MDWNIVEQHGLWWANKGELPPPEALRTHGLPSTSQIVGPYASRVIATEASGSRRTEQAEVELTFAAGRHSAARG
jgi:hypothetical protein